MSLSEPIKQQIDNLVKSSDVVLFMKGNKQFPQCGFSAQVVDILGRLGVPFNTVNVLTEPAIRDGIKEYSSWPTIPQLYVKGEFVGGCDIVKELHARGELAKLLGAKPEAPPKPPTIRLTEDAAKAIREASEDGEPLHFEVSPQYQYNLYFGPREEGEIEVEASGIKILMDASSARRADDTSIAYVEGNGGGFKITNPNEPTRVKQLTPVELKAMIDKGDKLELLDVRTPRERDIAKLEGARLLDEKARQELEALDKSTTLVFHCHHGGRSQQAAEHFLQKGFKNVFNLRGGIDAWSQTVDSKIPRY